MTGLRRFPIVVIAALLAAGCGAIPGAADPSPTPVAVAPTSTPQPSATTDPVATTEPVETEEPEASPEPSDTSCPVDPPTNQPGVWLYNGLARVQPVIGITRMATVLDPGTALPLPEIERPSSFMNVVGGRRSPLDLYYFDLSWPWGWNLTTLSAKLTLEGRRDPISLDVELASDSLGNVSGASVRFPDRDETGVLDVELAWSDTCFVYEGTVSSPVRIYPESSVAGCPTGRTASFDELGIAFDPPIFVGGVEADLVPWRFAGKVREMSVVDPLPPYVGLQEDTPTLTAAPSSSLTVTYENPALELTVMERPRVTFYERAPLLRWLDGGWIHGDEPEAPVVFRSKLVANPDGTFSFEAPPDPGRYAAEATFYYDAACTVGSAGFVVGVDVE